MVRNGGWAGVPAERSTAGLPGSVPGWTWLFLAASGVVVAETSLKLDLVPFAGTVAAFALWGMAAGGPARRGRLAVGGLALLTLAAGVVDAGSDGYGWPQHIGRAGVGGVALMAGGVAMLAAAGVRGAPRPGWKQLWPAGLIAALVLTPLLAAVVDDYSRWPDGYFFAGVPSLSELTATWAVRTLPVIALLLAVVAVNVVLAAGRRFRLVAAGLLGVAVLGMGAVVAGAEIDVRWPDKQPAYQDNPYEYSTARPLDETRITTYFVERPIDQEELRWAVEDEMRRAMDEAARDRLRDPLPAEAPGVEDGTGVSWSISPWSGEPDWSVLRPTLLALAVLGGLAAFTTGLMPSGDERKP
ncbi:hypothetical protein ACQP2F_34035 [Actinoplanes sp. CA-030573]|uniref:hypothetical protein n=1 Tax=Actinoplanes sp. CA-030573 TaxID=3239898 RepID=UPI003D920753